MEKNTECPKELVGMTRTNVLIEWQELKVESGLQLDENTKSMMEAKVNQCCKVLAVGDEVKNIKPGEYVLMGGTGRLITINDTVYGIIKEHMVDAVFSTIPKLGRDEGESHGTIRTDITAAQLEKFGKKHKYPQA